MQMQKVPLWNKTFGTCKVNHFNAIKNESYLNQTEFLSQLIIHNCILHDNQELQLLIYAIDYSKLLVSQPFMDRH